MDDKKIILDKVTQLFISKGKALDKQVLITWTQMLCNAHAIQDIINAIDQEIYSGDDYPTIAKVCDTIRARNGYDIEALDAWEQMIQAVRDHTTENLPALVKRCAQRCGGFERIGQAHINYEIPEIKKTFRRVYIYEKNNAWRIDFFNSLAAADKKQITID